MIKTWSSIIGWIGMGSGVLDALLLSAGVLDARTIYWGLSLLCSASLTFHSWERKTTQMVILNAVFMAISLVGLVRTW